MLNMHVISDYQHQNNQSYLIAERRQTGQVKRKINLNQHHKLGIMENLRVQIRQIKKKSEYFQKLINPRTIKTLRVRVQF